MHHLIDNFVIVFFKLLSFHQNHHAGLKQSAIRGLCSIFYTLARKSAPSQLGKQDEDGYSLAHYAALYNRPQILQLLIGQGQDLNVRRFHLTSSVGKSILRDQF